MTKTERQLELHRSLTKPILLGGGERELVILLWVSVIALVFGAGIRPLSLFVGLLVGVGGQFGLIKAAQVDPQWFAVYRRSLQISGLLSGALARPCGTTETTTLSHVLRGNYVEAGTPRSTHRRG